MLHPPITNDTHEPRDLDHRVQIFNALPVTSNLIPPPIFQIHHLYPANSKSNPLKILPNIFFYEARDLDYSNIPNLTPLELIHNMFFCSEKRVQIFNPQFDIKYSESRHLFIFISPEMISPHRVYRNESENFQL